jgi:hypothetical protein
MFKKVALIMLVSLVFLGFDAYALDYRMFDLRNKIFDESKDIKSLLAKSKDAVLLLNMFDSCIISVTQIDAYFSMLGVMDTIKKEDLTAAAIDLISNWLNQIKKTNESNIRNLDSVRQQIEPATKDLLDKLKDYFNELNKKADVELNKLSLLKRSLQIKSVR